MENRLIKQVYPYAWLDEVIEVTLNPEKTNVAALEENELLSIESQFDKELKCVLKQLKSYTFCLFSNKKIKATVSQYYESLRLLEQQAMDNLAGYPDGHPLAETGETLILYIQNMNAAFKKRYGKYITENKTENVEASIQTKPIFKILCKLSVDQIGIILKAADDSKLIISSSISVIFQSIVPFLSTDNTKNISWNSMRKSTYHIEQVDKEVTIKALEKLIAKIKDY